MCVGQCTDYVHNLKASAASSHILYIHMYIPWLTALRLHSVGNLMPTACVPVTLLVCNKREAFTSCVTATVGRQRGTTVRCGTGTSPACVYHWYCRVFVLMRIL